MLRFYVGVRIVHCLTPRTVTLLIRHVSRFPSFRGIKKRQNSSTNRWLRLSFGLRISSSLPGSCARFCELGWHPDSRVWHKVHTEHRLLSRPPVYTRHTKSIDWQATNDVEQSNANWPLWRHRRLRLCARNNMDGKCGELGQAWVAPRQKCHVRESDKSDRQLPSV